MKEKTDIQKIEYIGHVNSLDNPSGYHKKVAKRYLQELYDDTIRNHDRFDNMHDKGIITLEDCMTFQNNCIVFIKVLKLLNKKHKLLDRLID